MRSKHLQQKDFVKLRDTTSALKQHKSVRDVVKDYSLRHQVEISWDLNEDAKRDQMVRLNVGGNEVIVDSEELLRVLRWA